ncbi:hypothetical protein [Streptomyces achromogenes]|uniref:hypothetical protein n=1 Tax=Streptomyces achromogenes TaxID=67255 RepID=UPI003439DE6B
MSEHTDDAGAGSLIPPEMLDAIREAEAESDATIAAIARLDDRPTCTCLRLPMGPGQTCDAHQLPDPAAGPTVPEAAAQDRAHWADKYAGEGQ